MRRSPTVLAAIGALAAIAAPALASSGGGHAPMPLDTVLWELGIKTLDILVIAVLAYKLLKQPIAKALEARSESVRNALEEATAGRREAEARLKEFQEQAAGLEAEIEEMNRQAAADIEREQAIIVEEGRAAAEHVGRHARDTIRQEVLKARDDLHREAAQLAIKVATESVRAQAGAEDQRRLVEGYLAELETTR